MNRLATPDADLVEQLRQASPEKQRAVAIAACQIALTKTHLEHNAVEKACAALRTSGQLSAERQRELTALVSHLDQEYFQLQQAADEGRADVTEYLDKFAKARAASAILFASKEDPFEASTEAIYEATAALDDKDSLLSAVRALL